MSANKFISFRNNTSSSSANSTFIIDAESKILSVEIKANDTLIELPDPNTSKYDVIQYRKQIRTERDIIFTYAGLQKAKMYFHRNQTVIFNKFVVNDNFTWIT